MKDEAFGWLIFLVLVPLLIVVVESVRVGIERLERNARKYRRHRREDMEHFL